MKSIFKDRLKFLTAASAKISTLEQQLYGYLRTQFESKSWFLSRKNIFGQVIHVVKELTSLSFYYLEDAVVENNVNTMSKEASARHWAEISGHNVVRAISARGIIIINFQQNASALIGKQVMLRRYAQLKNDLNSLVYLLNIQADHQIISTSGYFVLPVIEGQLTQQTFTADGSKLFTVNLDDVNVVEHYETRVYVQDELWEKFESLYDMNMDSKGYTLKTGLTNQVDIVFGNGIQGIKPSNGDIIRVEYIQTRGEQGNYEPTDFPVFQFVSGVFDMQGNPIDINDSVVINKSSGFDLGSDGEDFETTRSVIGFNSRSMVLATDENIEAYLSRLSFLSRIVSLKDPQNTAVKKLLLLPNITNKIRSYNDYLNLEVSQFRLTNSQQTSIKEMLQNSKRSFVTNEIQFLDPILKYYSCIVYLQTNNVVIDKKSFKDQVCNLIIQYMISKTFIKSTTLDPIISKTKLIALLDENITGLVRASIIFISRENEEAKINGWYNKITTENIDGITVKKTSRILVPSGTDPRIGFNEYGDIIFDPEIELPIIQSGFSVVSNDLNVYTLNEPISVILNDGVTIQETL